MSAFLRCQVGPGMFSGEVAVRGKTAEGTEFSLFVADDYVEYDAPAASSHPVDGWIHVDVLAREGGLVLVRLPGQTFENGRTVTVRDCEVEFRPRHEAV